jgi:hypothetical protein
LAQKTTPPSPQQIVRYLPAPQSPPVRLEVDTNGAISQPPIPDEQISLLKKGLQPFAAINPEIPVYSVQGDYESKYTIAFMKLLKSIGFKPRGPLLSQAIDPTETGVMVGVLNVKKPPDSAQQFLKAIQAAGIDAHFATWMMPTAGSPFDLYIGPMIPP